MIKNCMFILKIKLKKKTDFGDSHLEWLVGKRLGNEKGLQGALIFLVKKWVHKVFDISRVIDRIISTKVMV